MKKLVKNGVEYREWEQGEDFREYLKNSPDNWHETYWTWPGWDENESYSKNIYIFYIYFDSYYANVRLWYVCKNDTYIQPLEEDNVELTKFWDKYVTPKFEIIKKYLK